MLKLPPNWVFRIVERIKHIKIQPRAMAIPFGLLGAAGRIVVLLILVVLCGSLFPLGRLTHISRSYREFQ